MGRPRRAWATWVSAVTFHHFPRRARPAPASTDVDTLACAEYFLFGEYAESREDEWCGEWREDHRSQVERFGVDLGHGLEPRPGDYLSASAFG
jgi:hypothetical protein